MKTLYSLFLAFCLFASCLLISCGASKKNVSINKIHVDSSSIEHAVKNFSSAKDSIGISSSISNYKKETTSFFQKIDLAPDDSVSPLNPVTGGLLVTNKTTGKKKAYFPASTITEWGNIAASQQSSTHEKIDSSADKQKNTNLSADKKTIAKDKESSGFNYKPLFWLVPLIIIIIIITKKYFKLF